MRSNPAAYVAADFMRKHWMRIKKHVNNPLLLPSYYTLDSPLGCGFWGCVYETGVDEIAVKVTGSDREGPFAQFAIGRHHPGFVSFFDVLEIPERMAGFQAHATRSFVIWRTKVHSIGTYLSTEEEYLMLDLQVEADEIMHEWSQFRKMPSINHYRKMLKDNRGKSNMVEALYYYLQYGWFVYDFHQNNIGLDPNGMPVIFDYLAKKL